MALVALLALAGCRAGGAEPAASSPPDPVPPSTSITPGTGSAAKPAMAYPGSPVVVKTSAGDFRIDVTGPSYPATARSTVPCTFVLTLSGADRPVSLPHATFDVLDNHGGVHPAVAQGSTAREVPVRLRPGASTVLRMRVTVPDGEGMLRFFPSGHQAVAAWDYVAETD